jgi:hypothetical protein
MLSVPGLMGDREQQMTKTIEIRLPEKLDLESILHFARKLDDLKEADVLQFDMGPDRWFPPFSLLFLASKIREFTLNNRSRRIFVINHEQHSYPSHMGFFKMFGLEYGRAVGEAFGSDQYLPITRVRRDELFVRPSDKYEELPDLIQKHSDKLAAMLSRDESGKSDFFNVLSYSVREIFRNVFEHGEIGELFYCAQYWPKSNRVEFSILDHGIGVRQGLGTNPNFRFTSDKEALESSLLPGVSGKTHLPRVSNNWFNSGYGLYMTNRLARNGGNFVIASGKKAILLRRKTKENFDTSFKGTALRLNFNLAEVGNVERRLSEFREDAIKIAATIKRAGNRPPSAMSLLLRRDYGQR